MKAVVLLSGGIDSAVCLYLAKGRGWQPCCLTFDYAQRHRRELRSAKRIAQKAGAECLVYKIRFPWKGSSLLDKGMALPKRRRKGIPTTYVPGRNIVFLSLALSYAEVLGARAIFIGANAVDFSGYPDCRPEFYRAFRRVARTGLKSKTIQIVTPLINKSKAGIIKLGRRLAVPFEESWSCYQGGGRPCGKCDSCRLRARGFRQAGIEDPC